MLNSSNDSIGSIEGRLGQDPSRRLNHTPIFDSARTQQGSTARIFGVDWERYLPRRISYACPESGQTRFGVVERTNAESFKQFILEVRTAQKAFSATASSGSVETSDPVSVATNLFFNEPWTLHRDTFLAGHGDVLQIRSEESPSSILAMSLSHVLDWSSYYFRYVWVRPRFRRLGFQRQLLRTLVSILSENSCDRFEVEISADHSSQIQFYLEEGFLQTGFRSSERWGNLACLTLWSNQTAEQSYRRFCFGSEDRRKKDLNRNEGLGDKND